MPTLLLIQSALRYKTKLRTPRALLLYEILSNFAMRFVHVMFREYAAQQAHLLNLRLSKCGTRLFPVLKEIVGNWLLRRHTPRVLWRGFKDAVSPSRAIPVLLEVVIEHISQAWLAIWSSVGP